MPAEGEGWSARICSLVDFCKERGKEERREEEEIMVWLNFI
jgi:hypothetical protein